MKSIIEKIKHFIYSHICKRYPVTEYAVGAVVRFDETIAIMVGLPKKNSAPDKEKDTMAWAEHMNMLKSMAEEVALAEVIYCE